MLARQQLFELGGREIILATTCQQPRGKPLGRDSFSASALLVYRRNNVSEPEFRQ